MFRVSLQRAIYIVTTSYRDYVIDSESKNIYVRSLKKESGPAMGPKHESNTEDMNIS